MDLKKTKQEMTLQIGGLELIVARLHSQHMSLDANYQIECTCYSSRPLQDFILQWGVINIHAHHQVVILFGILTNVSRFLDKGQRGVYRCILQSPLVLLEEVHSRVFSQRSLQDIFQVFTRPYARYYDLQWLFCQAKNNVDVIQYEESDRDCLQRLCQQQNCHINFYVHQQQLSLQCFQQFPKRPLRQYQTVPSQGQSRSEFAVSQLSVATIASGHRIAYAVCDDIQIQPMDMLMIGKQVWRVLLCDLIIDTQQTVYLIMIPEQDNWCVERFHNLIPWQHWLGYQPEFATVAVKTDREPPMMTAEVLAAPDPDGLIPIRFNWQKKTDDVIKCPSYQIATRSAEYSYHVGSEVVIGFIEQDIEQPFVLASLANRADITLSRGVQHILHVKAITMTFSEKRAQLNVNAAYQAQCEFIANDVMKFCSPQQTKLACQQDFESTAAINTNTMLNQQIVSAYSQSTTTSSLHIHSQDCQISADKYQIHADNLSIDFKNAEYLVESISLTAKGCQVMAEELSMKSERDLQLPSQSLLVETKGCRLHVADQDLILQAAGTLQIQAEHCVIPESCALN